VTPPGSQLYGQLNLPLYAATARPDVAAVLRGGGFEVTPFTSALELNVSHLLKLLMLYRLRAAGCATLQQLPEAVHLFGGTAAPVVSPSGWDFAAFLQDTYCLLARYETFTGNASAFQGAVPHNVFDALETACGVAHECFASPLNCHFPSFCSAFPDTDSPFGSAGSFFEWSPRRGAFEANPPFINSTMLAMAQRLDALLAAAAAADEPLQFFVIVPAWTDAYFHKRLESSTYTRVSGTLRRKEHDYIDGGQHKAERATWCANVDSTWFLLATDAGLRTYGVQPGQARDAITDAFAMQITSGDAADDGRVLKFTLPSPAAAAAVYGIPQLHVQGL
jgi:phosphorylated CTD-interacting factor 1